MWSSPTIDAAAGTIYFDTGNSGDCSSSEPIAPAVVELAASNLSLVASWAVPAAQDQGTPTSGRHRRCSTASSAGSPRTLVGVINKNGIFYAFERGALASGPIWTSRIAIGGGDPPNGNGDIASSAFDGTTLYVGGDVSNSCCGSLNALNPSTGGFIWQDCLGRRVRARWRDRDSGGVVAVGEGNNIRSSRPQPEHWSPLTPAHGPFWGTPSIANGTLYEGDMSGNLYALVTQSNQTSGHNSCRSTRRRRRRMKVSLLCLISRRRARAT